MITVNDLINQLQKSHPASIVLLATKAEEKDGVVVASETAYLSLIAPGHAFTTLIAVPDAG